MRDYPSAESQILTRAVRSLIPDLTFASGGQFLLATDPGAAIGPQCYFYLNPLAFAGNAANQTAIVLSRSIDRGTSWSPPVTVFESRTGAASLDKNWIAVNDSTGARNSGRLAVTWSVFTLTAVYLQSSVSDDLGLDGPPPLHREPARRGPLCRRLARRREHVVTESPSYGKIERLPPRAAHFTRLPARRLSGSGGTDRFRVVGGRGLVRHSGRQIRSFCHPFCQKPTTERSAEVRPPSPRPLHWPEPLRSRPTARIRLCSSPLSPAPIPPWSPASAAVAGF